MIDGEGNLGDPDDSKRTTAVENHYKWVEAARFLGCHSIRVNAQSEGSWDEQMKLAADGLNGLAEYCTGLGLSVLVENHGGLSSNGKSLAGTIKMVGLENCGTLPDFGNFRIQGDEWYDRYQGVRELMPYAKAVSAKSHDFDESGNEIHTDYFKMMEIVLKHGYHGYVGIEYEGSAISEEAGIRATKALLERVAHQRAATGAQLGENQVARRPHRLPALSPHLGHGPAALHGAFEVHFGVVPIECSVEVTPEEPLIVVESHAKPL